MLGTLKLTFIAALAMLGTSTVATANTGLDPVYPAATGNQNVAYLYNQYQIMLEEIDKSVTKKNAGLLSHDAARWETYIASMRSYVAYWASQAFMDYPATHGREWNLTDPLSPECDFKSNFGACEMMALVVNARDELVLSSSSTLPVHLYPADAQRQESYWQAMEGYIQFMKTNSPLDEPVTSAENNLGVLPGVEPDP